MRPPLAVLFALVCSPALAAEDPALVAPTGPRSPAEERKAFKVPDGFDVQLVASEPDIQKPMQMAFDAKGRLWVTTSYHYPFAAPAGKGTDKLFVLSDFGPDGKARKVETFAAGLNIPIGILPLPDCKGCVVSSVGEILKLTDTDGDGKADKREVLFAGFGTRDTHGMTNSFTLMPDGWVYACHGFANDSRVKGTDGHEVVMNSGHTFRFRPDGSRIEVVTRGQVNPFGIAVDPWFNLYTADCHSKPITQVIPGAYYDSFGKPHDGLGYGPHVTRHDHNSTGLCGVAWYDADHFPAEYKGCMFVGNVVTNRINFDRIEWKGSTPVAKELPDFLVSEDRWFRPTDIKLGPDGALYVTDFYNKIIGHYEVDLKHPGRDKDHGRLWRIVWTGKDAKPPTPARADFTAATDVELFALLGHPNLTVRMTAGNQLVARSKPGSMPDIRGDGVKDVGENPATMSAAAGWVASAAEAGGVGVADLYPYLVEAAKTVRPPLTPDQYSTLVMRAMGSHPRWVEQHRKTALRVLAEFDAPRLRRATVQAVAAHPHADFVKPLVELIPTIPADDTHLGLAARIALRNCLRDTPDGWDAAPGAETPAGAVVADVALAIPSERAASYLAEYIGHHKTAAPRLAEAAGHVGRYGKHPVRWPVIDRLRSESAAPVEPAQAARALEALRALVRGVQAGGAKLTPGEARSFESMAGREVADLSPSPAALAAVVDL
ncbi:MAG: hypothetical protein K2X82_20750, partial [Gemmataceae bacterium]|nr:hypothetical protein [Gemmataceae bacterium]